MAKISGLPVLSTPLGTERVIVADPADGGRTKSAAITPLVEAAARPTVARVEQTASDLARAYREISPGPNLFAFPILDPYGFTIGGFRRDGSLSQQHIDGVSTLKLAREFTGFAAPTMDNYGLIAGGMTDRGDMTLAPGPQGQAFLLTDGYGLTGFSIDRTGAVSGSAGVPVEPSSIFRADAVRGWRSKAHGMRFRGERAALAIIGDSQFREVTGQANRPLVQRLRAAFGNAGPGWCCLNTSSVGYSADDGGAMRGDATVTVTGTWQNLLYQPWSPDTRGIQSFSAGAAYVVDYPGALAISLVELHHAGGGIRYRYGAGSWTSLDLGASAGKVALAAPPAGPFSLQIEVVSGRVKIAGVVLAAATGCLMHNLAYGGSSALGWASVDQAVWLQALGRLGFDAVALGLGGNDESQSRSVAQYTADITSIVSTLCSANRAADIALCLRPQAPRSGVPEQMDAYASAARLFCSTLDLALFDARPRFGTSYVEYGYAGSRRQLFGPDNVHLNAAGADVFASGAAELFLA